MLGPLFLSITEAAGVVGGPSRSLGRWRWGGVEIIPACYGLGSANSLEWQRDEQQLREWGVPVVVVVFFKRKEKKRKKGGSSRGGGCDQNFARRFGHFFFFWGGKRGCCWCCACYFFSETFAIRAEAQLPPAGLAPLPPRHPARSSSCLSITPPYTFLLHLLFASGNRRSGAGAFQPRVLYGFAVAIILSFFFSKKRRVVIVKKGEQISDSVGSRSVCDDPTNVTCPQHTHTRTLRTRIWRVCLLLKRRTKTS